jgi:anti-sigma B factor antagonist
MLVKEEKKGDVVIFTIDGRLDSNTSPEVEKKILDAVHKGTHDIVLVFSNLQYLSSAGIRILVHCHKELEINNGQIVLTAVPKPIENILYITGFLPYFKIFENENEAIITLAKMRQGE